MIEVNYYEKMDSDHADRSFFALLNDDRQCGNKTQETAK